jgi:hypothetical protein
LRCFLSSARLASAPRSIRTGLTTVYCGEWDVGRIYQTRGGPESLRWFWSLTVNGPMTHADRVATLEEAKAQFQKIGMPGRRGRSWKTRVIDLVGPQTEAPAVKREAEEDWGRP